MNWELGVGSPCYRKGSGCFPIERNRLVSFSSSSHLWCKSFSTIYEPDPRALHRKHHTDKVVISAWNSSVFKRLRGNFNTNIVKLERHVKAILYYSFSYSKIRTSVPSDQEIQHLRGNIHPDGTVHHNILHSPCSLLLPQCMSIRAHGRMDILFPSHTNSRH